MKPRSNYMFFCDMEHGPEERHPDAPQQQEQYLASADLVRAVNLAIYLGRPLLLEGEAGCGKTRLAHAVAYELGLPLYRWDVRSTSKAQEGLYTYDAIRRLHDAQVRHLLEGEPASSTKQNPTNPGDYVRMGALGKAFQMRDRPAVVLIDEIDKADIDFPNDLLTVLDEPWAFEIHETGKPVQAEPDYRPIIIITSNKEKGNLPAPFLRRCIYHFIKFPEDQQLRAIVEAHFTKRGVGVPDSTDLAIQRFLALRNGERLHKKPGTSEFLDWLEALRNFHPPQSDAAELTEKGILPYPEALFKLRADWQHFVEQK